MSEPAPPTPAPSGRQALALALRRASATDKRVAVIFGADWCPDCHALDAALEHPRVRPIVEPAFEVVKIDVGQRDRHLDLMAEYGMAVERGIPAVAVLESDGRLVAAQTDGEWGSARSLRPIDFATFFHRWSARPGDEP